MDAADIYLLCHAYFWEIHILTCCFCLVADFDIDGMEEQIEACTADKCIVCCYCDNIEDLMFFVDFANSYFVLPFCCCSSSIYNIIHL